MWCAYICIWVNMVSDIVTPQWPLSHHCTISTFSVWTDCLDLGWVSKLDLGGGFLRGFKLGRKKTCQAFVQGGLSVVCIVWFRRKFCLSVGYRDIWDDFGGGCKNFDWIKENMYAGLSDAVSGWLVTYPALPWVGTPPIIHFRGVYHYQTNIGCIRRYTNTQNHQSRCTHICWTQKGMKKERFLQAFGENRFLKTGFW